MNTTYRNKKQKINKQYFVNTVIIHYLFRFILVSSYNKLEKLMSNTNNTILYITVADNPMHIFSIQYYYLF